MMQLPEASATLDQFERRRVHCEQTEQLLARDGHADVAKVYGDERRLLDDALTREPSLLGGPHAWVMGNEARGLSEQQEALCDVLVRVPMTGAAESLNLAAAAAMCLFSSQHVRTHHRR